MAILARLLIVWRFVLPAGDLLLVGGGDGVGYYRLAISILETHQYTHPLFLARPPLFPTLAAVLYGISGSRSPWLVIAANLLLSSLTAGLTVVLASRWGMARRAALLAGLFAALDPTSAYYGVAPLTEALLTFLLVCGFIVTTSLRASRGSKASLLAGFVGALCGLAMLTKPVAILFWGVLVTATLLWRKWRASLIIALVSLAFLIGWTAHNLVTFNMPVFSTVGTWNMLFIRGTSVLRRITPEPPAVIEARLAEELERRVGGDTAADRLALGSIDESFGTPDPIDYYFIWPDPRRFSTMQAMALEIYLAHPGWSLVMTFVGLYKMYFGVPSELPLSIARQIFSLLIYLSAGVGGFRLWRQNVRDVAILITGTVLYFTLISVATTTAAISTRFVMPFFPLLGLAAAYAATDTYSRLTTNPSSMES